MLSAERSGSGAVVMAVYRPDPILLKRQIESLGKQTVTDWRCLIGIDGADPDTRLLLRQLTCDDPRFDVREYADNVGVYRHFERLLRQVDSDVAWVALADQDDYWYPDKFERLLPLLSERGVTAVSGQASLIDASGTVLGVTERRGGSIAEMLLRNQVTGCLSIFEREVVVSALPFPEGTDMAIHDHWLGVCAAGAGEVRILDELVQDYVQHGGNVLGEAAPTRIAEHWRAASSSVGMHAHADTFARSRWGWRVAMARQVLLQQPRLSADPGVAAVAEGRASVPLARLVARNVVSRRVRPLAGAGTLASAWLWSRPGVVT